MHKEAHMKIRELGIGEEAEIVGYESATKQYRSKLLAMGLTKGTTVTLTKIAPLGDPVELHVRGFKLSLRKDEAGMLQVRRKT